MGTAAPRGRRRVLVGLTGPGAEGQSLPAAGRRRLRHDRHQVADGDQSGARATLEHAQRAARQARDSTSGPGWWLSGFIPQVGPTSAPCSRRRGLRPARLGRAARRGHGSRHLATARLRPVDGRIDLARSVPGHRPWCGPRSGSRSRTRWWRRSTYALAPEIARPVTCCRTRSRARTPWRTVPRAVRLLPSMLGAHGKRNYLFLFQNNAEVRATGGIPGSFALLTASHGKVTLGRQDDAGSLGRFVRPPIPLTGEEKALFEAGAGRLPQDVNFTPDFPRTAELAAAMYRAKRGLAVDGVVSVIRWRCPTCCAAPAGHAPPADGDDSRRRCPAAAQGRLRRHPDPGSSERLLRCRRPQRVRRGVLGCR